MTEPKEPTTVPTARRTPAQAGCDAILLSATSLRRRIDAGDRDLHRHFLALHGLVSKTCDAVTAQWLAQDGAEAEVAEATEGAEGAQPAADDPEPLAGPEGPALVTTRLGVTVRYSFLGQTYEIRRAASADVEVVPTTEPPDFAAEAVFGSDPRGVQARGYWLRRGW